LIFLGTPSSGLVFWAQLLWTPSPRNNNRSSFPTLPLLSSYPKLVFFASFRSNTISSNKTSASGNLSSNQTANPLLSLKVLSHKKTTAPSYLQSNLPLTMHSPSHTLTSFTTMLVTTPFVQSMPPLYPLPIYLPIQNKLVSITSWQTSLTPGLLLCQTLLEHYSHILSSLVQEADPSGLVQGLTTGTQWITSCSAAHPFPPHTTISLAFTPLTLMSLEPSMVLFYLVISNAPPTVSYTLCPPD